MKYFILFILIFFEGIILAENRILGVILIIPTIIFVISFLIDFQLKEIFYVFFPKLKPPLAPFEVFIGEDILNLMKDSRNLLNNAAQINDISDYSYIILPAAKAYEGILKKILTNKKFVTENELKINPDVAINKYFNPLGNSKIFDALNDKIRDKTTPHIIYSTYQECRNVIFHYDPYKDTRITSLEEAKRYLEQIESAINKAYYSFI